MYPFVFQCFSEPICALATITKQPLNLGQTALQRAVTAVIIHLSCSDKKVRPATTAVANGVAYLAPLCVQCGQFILGDHMDIPAGRPIRIEEWRSLPFPRDPP